jgi:putative peptidoglycan lipid II flippase
VPDLEPETTASPHISSATAGPVSPALRRLLRFTGWLVILGLASKVLGLFVQIATARYFGVDPSLDAFNLALSLPEILFQFMMLGALSQVMIPFMADRERLAGREGAREFFRRILGLLVIVSLLTGALAILFTGALVDIMAPGFDDARRTLAIRFCRLMLINLGLSAFIYYFKAGLHLRQRFLLVGFSALAGSAVQILAVVLMAPRFGAEGLAWASILLNGVTAVILIAGCAGASVPIGPAWPRIDDSLGRLLGQAWVVGVFVLVNVLISATDRYFASLLPPGSISILSYAWKFEPVFLGVLAGAATAPIYTELSQAAAMGDRSGVQTALSRGLKLMCVLAFPTAALVAGLSHPIIVLFFERGEFTPRNSHDVARVLSILSFTFACWSVGALLVQTMNALKRPQISLIVVVASMVLNFILDALLYRPLGVAGLAWATTLLAVPMTFVFTTIALREVGLGWSRSLRRFLGSVVLLSALAGLAAYAASQAVSFWPPLHRLMLGGLSGGAIVALGLVILKPPELRLLPGMRRD